MAWNSSRTGVAIAAFWMIVCVSPPALAQEWVRWRGTPSLLDQDPAKRLPQSPAPKARTPQAAGAAREVVPVPEPPTVARPAPLVAAQSVAIAPTPPAVATQAPVPSVSQAAPADAATAPAALAGVEVATIARTPVVPAAGAALPAATMPTATAPTRGAPAITLAAPVDAAALEIAPLSADEPSIAATADADAEPERASLATAAVARAETEVRAPRAGGAYVTVGSDGDASVVAAAPQVYSCDESGRCEHLENELPSVGLQAAPGVNNSPHRQIESEIKRSALRGF